MKALGPKKLAAVTALVGLFLVATPAAAQSDDGDLVMGEPLQIEIPAAKLKAWHVRVPTAREVTIKVLVRNNQPIDYLVTTPDEADLYEGGSRETIYHLENFYGEGVRNREDSEVLAPGRYSLIIVNRGSNAADAEITLSTAAAPAGSTPAEVARPPSGRVDRGEDGAGRYTLAVSSFNVSWLKNGSGAWDADGSSPDVKFSLAFGEGTGVSNIERVTSEDSWDNQHSARGRGDNWVLEAWNFDWNGRGDIILVVWDLDAFGSKELVAAGTVQQGDQPGHVEVLLEDDLSSFLDGRLGNYEAEGTIHVRLAWERVE